MARPAVLLIDPVPERLEELSHGLAANGYEAVPVAGLALGRRFAKGLDEALIVTTTRVVAESPDPEALIAELHAGGRRTLVLLGGHPAEEEGLPETVSFLAMEGQTLVEIERRLLLVLLGREVGAAPDVKLESLVGDLAQTPLLELLRGLNRAQASGRIELRGGQIWLDRGEVVAAVASPVQGLKAFCRLGRMHEGPFQLFFGDPVPQRNIEEELSSLIITAIEDSLGEFPDPRARLELGDSVSGTVNPLQKQILELAQAGATLQEVLDGLPARDGEIVQELLTLEERRMLARRDANPKVQIVTDSTADLPSDLVQAHGIAVVPLTVAFGKEVFRDRVEIQPGQFYKMLTTSKTHPKSSPPPQADFAERYREWLAQGHEVVSLHISAKLSKTFEHASAAADEVDGAGLVSVVDTGQVSAALGMLALFAARMAARNETAATIRERLLDMAPRIHTLFVVDTLEFLAKGGRIGKAQALMGGLLGIKPILGMVAGEVAPVDRVRGGRAAHPRILELLHKRVEKDRPVVAGVSHANAPVWADRLRALVRDEFQVAELIQTEVGPVVGANVGPGVVGVCLFQPREEEMGWVSA
ncbi:MAG TPA: DegV family protein [Thermoanaerobaculia bacterium]|nr:DegV family protein [Thermoanaerobaculia bacterium]